jgi:hypothetical protein
MITVQGPLIGISVLCGLVIACDAAMARVSDSSCPSDAIAVEPGASMQAAVDRGGDGTVFCVKSGVYRAQAVRPRGKQLVLRPQQAIQRGLDDIEHK